MSQSSDEDIAIQIQRGNHHQFGKLIDRYQSRLFAYLKSFTNQSDYEVEDLLEDTLVKAYINIQSFDPTQKFSSWIYRIAHNCCIDFFRRYHSLISLDDQDEIFLKGDKLHDEIAVTNEQSHLLNQIVGSLELKYKEVIILYFFEDKSYQEISDILHLPVNHVGVLLNRAKKILKSKLSHYVQK